LLLGIKGQFLAQAGMTVGVSWSLASNGAILSMLIPLVSALLATRLLRERLTPLRIGSLLLGSLGVVLLTPLSPAATGSLTAYPFAGNLMIAAGCFWSAFYNVYSKRLLDRFTGLEVLFFSYLATAIVGLPVLLACDRRLLAHVVHLDLRGWAALGYLTIFLYGLAMIFFLRLSARWTPSSRPLHSTSFPSSASHWPPSCWASDYSSQGLRGPRRSWRPSSRSFASTMPPEISESEY
jgi:drug/metabolite transporter (DMT)-like permease